MEYNYNIIKIKSADSKIIPCFEFKPKEEPISSIILIYEIFGMTEHIKRLSNRLAESGFLVYVPDIFFRVEENLSLKYDKLGFHKGIKLKEKLGWDLPVMDIVAVAAQLKTNYKVNVLGFCFGGSLAWLAMQKSYIFDKGICYYGSSIPEFLNANINCSAMLHFGKNDKGIPMKAIKKISSYANEQPNKIIINEYNDADHGFNCEDRKSYNSNAAEMAMHKTLKFIRND